MIKAAALIIFSINLHAEKNTIAALYQQNNIIGSIIIESFDGKTRFQYNMDDTEGFIPASTFKIPNTLIMLEEGLIKNQSDLIKWDGKVRGYDLWDMDQTLKSAFQYSCVWCYQRYAKIIGDEKYHQYLHKFDYGNLLTGSDVTSFWLDGELRVSVEEQINFLRKVYKGELPIKKEHIQTLKSIMLSEEHENFKIWSKTGWAGKDGWYVGYLTIDKQTWFFANHIEIHQKSDLGFRKKLTIEVFKSLGILH